MNENITIEQYTPNDFEMISELWKENLKDSWPINSIALKERLNSGDHFFAYTESNTPVGFVATQHQGKKAHIALILIESSHQRNGIGARLVEYVENQLREKGVDELFVGSGAGSYFWPGVPNNSPSALSFFKKLNWNLEEENVDMVFEIKSFKAPIYLYEKIGNINLTMTDQNNSQKVLLFEQNYFPEWYDYFKNELEKGNFGSILIATDVNNEILGTVILNKPNPSFIWSPLLPNCGGFGSLGVNPSKRGLGIGLALAAKATEILRDQGVRYSYLAWTYLVDWYGQLGYSTWRTYRRGSKNIAENI